MSLANCNNFLKGISIFWYLRRTRLTHVFQTLNLKQRVSYHRVGFIEINSLSQYLKVWISLIYRRPDILSVVRQKGESQNECFKKTKHAKFSKKTNISCPLMRSRTCDDFWKITKEGGGSRFSCKWWGGNAFSEVCL